MSAHGTHLLVKHVLTGEAAWRLVAAAHVGSAIGRRRFSRARRPAPAGRARASRAVEANDHASFLMAERAAAPADHERVACPSCGVQLPFAVLNEHLDRCLANNASPEKKRAPPSSPPRAVKAPRLGAARPFAERMRPQTLDEYVGQSDIVHGTLLGLLRKGQVPSMVLWGPPGSGKTTLARLVTREANGTRSPAAYRFVEMSATTASVNDVKRVIDESVHRQQLTSQKTILFIDEIQRFNRAQQDLFLPALERGHITLLAATTENPSFRLQSALLSRLRVVVLSKLSDDDCLTVLRMALERVRRGDDHVFDAESYDWIDDDLLAWMAHMADGDARTALHMLELTLAAGDDARDMPRLKASLRRTALTYGTCMPLMQTALAMLTTIPLVLCMCVGLLTPEKHPWIRSQCGSVLACAHGMWRRRSLVYCTPPDCVCLGRLLLRRNAAARRRHVPCMRDCGAPRVWDQLVSLRRGPRRVA